MHRPTLTPTRVQRIRALFDQALDHTPATRSAFLEQASGGSVDAEAPRIERPAEPVDGRATVEFSSMLRWRTTLSGSRSGRVRFAAQLELQDGVWRMVHCRIVDAPSFR